MATAGAMVGATGRSKSCGTCRIRKKGGCDRKRPSCGQCVKFGLRCDGYERETIFINSTTTKTGAAGASGGVGMGLQSHKERHGGSRMGSGVRGGYLPHGLVKSAFEEKYLGVFWETYLPEGRRFPAHLIAYSSGGWTTALHQFEWMTPPIRKILLAMSLKTAGQRDGTPWERAEGLRCYVSSLTEMGNALSTPGKGMLPTLCVTTRLYSLYEILFGRDEQDGLAQARNWRKHIDGELAVVTSQEPETYVTGYLHQLFVDGRFHLTTGSVRTRKKTVLSEPDWKTVPWRKIPKTPKDLLMDIFVETPTLLEDFDEMKECSDPELQEIQREKIIQTCWDLDKRLRNWRNKLGMPDPSYTLKTARPFSVDLLAATHLLCIYWSTCILVYSTLQFTSDAPPQLPAHTDPRLACRRIAEALSVLVNPLSGAFGTHLANFPVAVALKYLGTVDGESVSAEKGLIFKELEKTRSGKIINRFLESLSRQPIKQGQMATRARMV